MNKYKDYWYEVKQYGDFIQFCFYDTEDKYKNAWCFNAESYSFKDCIEKIKEISPEKD